MELSSTSTGTLIHRSLDGLDEEDLSQCHRPNLGVEAADRVRRARPALDEVPLDRLRRLIEDAAVCDGATQLDVLRVRPHQRSSRSGRLAEKQLADRNV